MRPKFTNNKMKSFLVVRAGNSVRITVNFEVGFISQLHDWCHSEANHGFTYPGTVAENTDDIPFF